jgi:hypothetical protein
MAMLVSILILTNVLTGVAMVSYMCDAVHDREQAAMAKRNIKQATDMLDREWQRLDRELAEHRKLTKEMAAMGGNRIKDYL